ncbi:hypothetical protein [Corticicoccus populi]|uniref:DUF3953 domain-containing protein n=1 Tax=Corticicoccus populi TaxID=1812821 RepID=A0ABW5WQA6_9STAP
MNSTQNRRSIFDYAVILLAVIGFWSLFFYPAFMNQHFSILLSALLMAVFTFRTVNLARKKSFGPYFMFFLLLSAAAATFFFYEIF